MLAVVSQPRAWCYKSRTCLISSFMQEASVSNRERPEVKFLCAVWSQPSLAPFSSSGLPLSSLSLLLELSIPRFFWLSPKTLLLWPGRVMDSTARLWL